MRPEQRAASRGAALWRRTLLAGALTLVVAACGAEPPSRGDSTSAQQRLAELRAATALPTCPSGISPQLPDVTLPCLSGGPDVAIADAGPPVPTLVNIWATWCPPCVREVPILVEVADQSRGRLRIVGVLTQDTPRNSLEFARQFHMNYTSVVDYEGTVMRRFSSGPPVTLFVAGDGTIKHIRRGAFKHATELRQLLAQHLNVSLAGPP